MAKLLPSVPGAYTTVGCAPWFVLHLHRSTLGMAPGGVCGKGDHLVCCALSQADN